MRPRRPDFPATACLALSGLAVLASPSPASTPATADQDILPATAISAQAETILVDQRNGRVLDTRLDQSLAGQLDPIDKADAGDRLRAELQAQSRAISPRLGPWRMSDDPAPAAIPAFSSDGYRIGELVPAGSSAGDPLVIRRTAPQSGQIEIPLAEARYCSDAHAIVLRAGRDELGSAGTP